MTDPGQVVDHVWANPCRTDGQVEAVPLVATDRAETATDPGFAPKIDIEAVGLRYGPADPADPESPTVMEWHVRTRGSRRVPVGGQFGVRAGQKLRGEQLRALLALMVLAVALRILFDLVARPSNLYSIVPLAGA